MDRPAEGVHLFYIDGAGVLFSEATQELHLLNTTAAVIWSLLEEGHNAETASEALQQMSGLDAQRSTEFVAAALKDLRDRHFLDDSLSTRPDQRQTVSTAIAPITHYAWHEGSVVEERHYRILGSGFRLRFSSAAQARIVHPVIEHLEVRDPLSEETVVDILEVIDGMVVYRNREAFDKCASVNQLAPIVKSLVWMTAVENHKFFLDIHAGVVGDGSKCVLLPAPPGSGKSTLTASLVHAGFTFFSDEVALLEESSFNVFPLPLAICVKASGIEALADRFPILRDLPVHQRADGKRVTYMPPPSGCRPSSDVAQPVAALIFPQYAPDAPTLFVPLLKYDALKRLLDECLVVSSHLDFDKVRALVEWISRTPCHGLRYRSTEEAITAVKSVFADSATTAGRSRSVAGKG